MKEKKSDTDEKGEHVIDIAIKDENICIDRIAGIENVVS